MSELSQYIANGVVSGAIYALMAIGLTIIFGHMGVVNFAHGGLYAFGAYIGLQFATTSGLGFFGAIAAAAVVMGVIGMAFERGLLQGARKKSPVMTPMLITIGAWLMLQNLIIVLWGASAKRLDSPVGGSSVDLLLFKLQPQQLFVVILAFALIVAVHLWLKRSHVGLMLRSTFQDADAAWLMGINTRRMYGLGFALGAGLAAVAGVLVATLSALTPTMGDAATAKAFAVVIIGGLGSFPGVVIGALVLGIAESLASGYLASGYADAVAMAVLLGVLMLRPEGIFGTRVSVKG